MTFDEDDLRRALHSDAQRYDPAGDGWDGIQRGVRAAHDRRRRIQGGVLGALVLAVAATGVGISLTGDDTDVEAGEPATAPASPTTGPADEPGAVEGPTTVPPTTTVPATTLPLTETGVAALGGIWPFAGQRVVDGEDVDPRFLDPVATADAFARDYLGMLDPVVGEAEPAGGGAVTVTLRPRGEDGEPAPEGGPSTVVMLVPIEPPDETPLWTVISATSPNIAVEEPSGPWSVASPVTVEGEATGYEGTVLAEVRQAGMRAGASLGEAVGIAGASGAMAPFDLEVAYARPTEARGALVVTTDTGLDGVGVPEATVVGLSFDDVADRSDDDPPGGPSPCAPVRLAGAPAPDEMDVRIYLTCDAAAVHDPGSDAAVVPAYRRVPRTAGVLRATLEQLVAGPTPEERAAGQGSFFSQETADILGDVTITDGTAIVDLREPVDNASTSAGQLAFRAALDRTVLQFPTVERVEYRLDGSCDAFWSWQQVGDCQLVTRDDL